MNLTEKEINIINMLSTRICTTESKIRAILSLYPALSIEIAFNRTNEERINELFIDTFTTEEKSELILNFYSSNGYKFNSIQELIENRTVIFFPSYDISWRKKRQRRFNNCYCYN